MPGEQLKFAICLGSDRKPEIKIPPNRSVRSEDIPRLSRQAKRIYELLQTGTVTTSQLSAIACQYNARLSEVRHYLIKDGLMVDEVPGTGGENQYCIVKLNESTFWRKVRERQGQWKWL